VDRENFLHRVPEELFKEFPTLCGTNRVLEELFKELPTLCGTNRVLEELFKEFPTLYGTKGFLPCSQGPVTGLLP
jgi:hypothetical protein